MSDLQRETAALIRSEALHAESLEEWDPICHCGDPVAFGFDGDPTHHRGMCTHCDTVRCDAYPGECGR